MYELITEKTLPEYEAFVQSHPKGNFAQSYLWGKQKPMWKWDAVAVRGAPGHSGDLLADEAGLVLLSVDEHGVPPVG